MSSKPEKVRITKRGVSFLATHRGLLLRGDPGYAFADGDGWAVYTSSGAKLASGKTSPRWQDANEDLKTYANQLAFKPYFENLWEAKC